MYVNLCHVCRTRCRVRLSVYLAYPSLKPHILFHSNALAVWHRFPDITQTKVTNGRKSAIFNLIELKMFSVAHFV